MEENNAEPYAPHTTVQIDVGGVKKLTSLEEILTDAIIKKYQVQIHSSPKDQVEEAQDILKCTYVAGILCKRGYDCRVYFLPNDTYWICSPSPE